MSSPVLPMCVAFQSKQNGNYLRYVTEDGETKKFLQMSGEDAISPYTRFYVEPSRKHDGLVHIKCCYNNKYWVAHKANNESLIVGDADEPEEDLSKPSCTLFKPIPIADNPGSASCRLLHCQLGEHACMFADSDLAKETLKGCLRIGHEVLEGQDLGAYTILNLADQFVLPKYLCFKGNNDKYLSGQVIKSRNYLQFSSDDIGDPDVRNTIYTNKDGTIRIKSDRFDKFWRRSPNWILADSEDTTSNDPNALFRVIKAGEIFGLRNLGNNYFCKRLTADGKTNCLNAAVPTITNEAQLRLEETVLSRKIYNVDYHLMDAKVYGKKVQTMSSAEAVNCTSTANTYSVTLTYKEMVTTTWQSSVILKLGVKTTISAGVPAIAGVGVEITYEFTGSYTWGSSIEDTKEHSINYQVIVPAHTRVTVSLIATQGTCDVPFSYYQEDVLTTGDTVVYKMDDGLYTGANSYDFKFETKEEKL